MKLLLFTTALFGCNGIGLIGARNDQGVASRNYQDRECTVTMKGALECVSSINFPRSYLENDACSTTKFSGRKIASAVVDTENYMDVLLVNGKMYSGRGANRGLVGEVIQEYQRISWSSDEWNQYGGWQLCFEEEGFLDKKIGGPEEADFSGLLGLYEAYLRRENENIKDEEVMQALRAYSDQLRNSELMFKNMVGSDGNVLKSCDLCPFSVAEGGPPSQQQGCDEFTTQLVDKCECIMDCQEPNDDLVWVEEPQAVCRAGFERTDVRECFSSTGLKQGSQAVCTRAKQTLAYTNVCAKCLDGYDLIKGSCYVAKQQRGKGWKGKKGKKG